MNPIEEKRNLKLFNQEEIDRFKIIKRISKESSSSVFHVVEKETNKNYVLKIIEPAEQDYDYDQEYDASISLSLEEIRSFIAESEIISKLNYPLVTHIIGICFHYEFDNETIGVMVFEYCQNGSISNFISKLNDTKKLICIYGIASAMEYLHSHRIIHGCLKPSNILLDEFFHPKINDFGTSKDIEFDDDTVPYLAPEVINNNDFTQKADVYSFGITVHEILTGKRPNLFKEIELSEKVPKSYRNLVTNCLNFDPNQRLNFSEIVKLLKNDKSFITESIDEIEFSQFCEFLEISKQKEGKKPFFKVNIKPIDKNLYKIGELVSKSTYSSVYKVTNIESSDVFLAKINNKDLNLCDSIRIQNLTREIEILSKLKSKSILKFIGYCEQDKKTMIITEFTKTNFSLDQIIEKERKENHCLNDTKKLIILFGIAFGMSYLHSLNIIHRDLKPANIFLDDSLFPKIGNFDFAKEINHNDENDFAGTPAYMSPEILTKIVNNKPSDVYSFSLIAYELMTFQIPFKGFDRIDILMKISTGYRPKINSNVPDCYRKLIEECWSQNPANRPTFNEIVNRLKTDQSFITNSVNKDEFLKYVDYLFEGSENIENNNNNIYIEEEEEVVDDVVDDKNIESNTSFLSDKIDVPFKEEKILKIENSEEADESEKTFKSEQHITDCFESDHNSFSEKEEKEETPKKLDIDNEDNDKADNKNADKTSKLPQPESETEEVPKEFNIDNKDNGKSENNIADKTSKLPQPEIEAEEVHEKLNIDNKDKDKSDNDITNKTSKQSQSKTETKESPKNLNTNNKDNDKSENKIADKASKQSQSKTEAKENPKNLNIDNDKPEKENKITDKASKQSQSKTEAKESPKNLSTNNKDKDKSENKITNKTFEQSQSKIETKESPKKMNINKPENIIIDKKFQLPHSALETEGISTKLDIDYDYDDESENETTNKKSKLAKSKNKKDEMSKKQKINRSENTFINRKFQLPHSALETEGISTKLDIDYDYDDESENEITDKKSKLAKSKIKKDRKSTKSKINKTENEVANRSSKQSRSKVKTKRKTTKQNVNKTENDLTNKSSKQSQSKMKTKRNSSKLNTNEEDNEKAFKLSLSKMETDGIIAKLGIEYDDDYDDEETENESTDKDFELPQSKMETDGVITKLEIDEDDDDETENDFSYKNTIPNNSKLKSGLESEGITIQLIIDYDDTESDISQNIISRRRKIIRKKRRRHKKSTIKSDDETDEPMNMLKDKLSNKAPNRLQNNSSNKLQNSSQSKSQDNSPNKSPYISPNKLHYNLQNKSQDNSPNKLHFNLQSKSQNNLPNKSPDKSQDNSPNKLQYNSQSKSQNNLPNKLQGNSLNKSLNKSTDNSPNKSPDKSQNNLPNKLQYNSQNKSQDNSPNKLQFNSQNKSQDNSPNKLHFNLQSKSQDNSPNKLQGNSLNKSPIKSTDNSPNKSLEKQQGPKPTIKLTQSLKPTITTTKADSPKNTEQLPKSSPKKPTITTTKTDSPKNTEQLPKSSPKKPFKSHYDPRVFYTRFYPSKTPQMPTHDLTSDPIKLTVTLKDIGLEGLDSKVPDKTKEIRTHEKVENEISISYQPKFKQTSLTSSESNLSINDSDIKKPTSLLLSTKMAQKSHAIIPTASPRRDMRKNKSDSNC